ncbi:MAG: FAD-dependent monooxygenase, partial [Myxococcales bacterium]|nr:FAD-dependent monooxygenase [Myxococcales bacterium]
DLAIVGAGPAGASSALHLAQLAPSLARRTVILERSSHPRPKLCGGGLVNDVDVILGNLGLDLRELPYADATWAHLHFRGQGLRMQLGKIAFHVIRRPELDAWLIDRARDCGVKLFENTRVHEVTPGDDGVLLETSAGRIRARAVIGADGSKGIVRRSIDGATKGPVARLVELITPPHDPADVASDEALFEFRHVPAGIQGYFWSFPMEQGGAPMRNWGVYDSRLNGTPQTGSLLSYLGEELARHGLNIDDYRVQGHPIRLFSPRSRLSTPGIVLAGDAAGADPLLGEGISLALGYGDLAAAAVADAFARGDFSFADYTARVHRSPMGRALRRRHFAAKMIYGLRGGLTQRMVWWRLQPLLRRFIRRYVFSWAAAKERPLGVLPPPPLDAPSASSSGLQSLA